MPPKAAPAPSGGDAAAPARTEGNHEGKGTKSTKSGPAWRPKGAEKGKGGPGVPLVTPNTITLSGEGLQTIGEQSIAEACQQIAIDGGFSVHELVTIPLSGLAHVEFAHPAAASEFMQATRGNLKIGRQSFKVRHPRGVNSEAPAAQEAQARFDATKNGLPTSSLVVRNLGDATEADVRQAFANLVPRLKSVKVLKDYAGQTKGIGWVNFFEIDEASIALRRFKTEGCTIAGRHVLVDFQEPNNMEAKLELEARKQKAVDDMQAQHEQALSGPNADMWANYLAMFDQGGAPNAKQARLH
jgi:hypothetical protein